MAGNPVKSFSCPACGGIVEIHAVGHSISAVCAHCSTLIDTANNNFKIIKKAHEGSRHTDIEIGAKGMLDGVKWEVIGYVEKKDKSSLSFWEEYLLFNPYFGFRFLIQSEGHWNFAGIIKRYSPLAGSASELELDGEKYSIYCRGISIVEYVKGEFYWRVRKGDEERYVDYIAPPRMLSVERSKQEVTLSLSEYLQPEEVAKAFGVELPDKTGVAANQPAPFAGTLGKIWKVTGLSILAALLIQWNSGEGINLNNSRIHIAQGEAEKTFSTPVFSLPNRTNLFVNSLVPVSNNWMELELSLVNEITNEVYRSRQVIEYYHGYEGGESWSEGGQLAESAFSAVPAGDYRLVIDPSPGQLGPNGMDVSLEIKRNIRVWGNFWFIFLSIIVFPVIALLYRWNFESRRWENSDYAPAVFRMGESDE
ncbi:MAG: DUF4178 domain-containing protein [Gallionellaceae bacterium]|jgi:hypothetical protein